MTIRSESETLGAIVFASPASVGHVRPLMPLARRTVAATRLAAEVQREGGLGAAKALVLPRR